VAGQYYQIPNAVPPPVPDMPPPYSITINLPGTPNPPPPVTNPCNGSATGEVNTTGPANIHTPAYQGAITALTATLPTDATEKSAFLGINPTNGQFETETPSGANNNSNTSYGNPGQFTNFLPFAGVHTHTVGEYDAPSAGDVYNMAIYNPANPSYTASYVVCGSDNTTTVLVVTDRTKLAAFLANYPAASNVTIDGQYSTNSPLYGDFTNVKNTIDAAAIAAGTNVVGGDATDMAAFRAAAAYVLDKYDTGLSISIENADGTFSQVHYVKGTDANGHTTYTKYNCN
jgi:hypothetical protein